MRLDLLLRDQLRAQRAPDAEVDKSHQSPTSNGSWTEHTGQKLNREMRKSEDLLQSLLPQAWTASSHSRLSLLCGHLGKRPSSIPSKRTSLWTARTSRMSQMLGLKMIEASLDWPRRLLCCCLDLDLVRTQAVYCTLRSYSFRYVTFPRYAHSSHQKPRCNCWTRPHSGRSDNALQNL